MTSREKRAKPSWTVIIKLSALSNYQGKKGYLSDESMRPTDPFTTMELQNPVHDVPELCNARQSPDIKALKLWKGRSGSTWMYCYRLRQHGQLGGVGVINLRKDNESRRCKVEEIEERWYDRVKKRRKRRLLTVIWSTSCLKLLNRASILPFEWKKKWGQYCSLSSATILSLACQPPAVDPLPGWRDCSQVIGNSSAQKESEKHTENNNNNNNMSREEEEEEEQGGENEAIGGDMQTTTMTKAVAAVTSSIRPN